MSHTLCTLYTTLCFDVGNPRQDNVTAGFRFEVAETVCEHHAILVNFYFKLRSGSISVAGFHQPLQLLCLNNIIMSINVMKTLRSLFLRHHV